MIDENNVVDLINRTRGELGGKAWHKILLRRPGNI
jgi:hypothetical protein